MTVDDAYRVDAEQTLTVATPGVLANDRDPDGDPITARLVTSPAHGTLTLNTDGSFDYTPAASFSDIDSFTYKASDGRLESNLATVKLRLNHPPAITSTPLTTGSEGQLYRYDVAANDPDGDALRFLLTTAPAGMAINPTTGLIQWAPSRTQAGPHAVTIQVADERGGTATQSYTIAVAEVLPNAPIITSTPVTTATEGVLYQYDVAATDADNDPLRFSLIITPTGMIIDTATGLISWTPSGTQAGQHLVSVRVSDGHRGSYAQSYVSPLLRRSTTRRSSRPHPRVPASKGCCIATTWTRAMPTATR